MKVKHKQTVHVFSSGIVLWFKNGVLFRDFDRFHGLGYKTTDHPPLDMFRGVCDTYKDMKRDYDEWQNGRRRYVKEPK